MRILLHEFVTGGGWFAVESEPPTGSLLAEGTAMRDALLAGLDSPEATGLIIDLLHDARLPQPREHKRLNVRRVSNSEQEQEAIRTHSREVDGVLLIAPECGGNLTERCEWVEREGGKLLGPSSEFVRKAADKSRCAELLRAAGVPTPIGRELTSREPLPRDFPYPAVLKPVDGAGSIGVALLEGPNDPHAELSRQASFVSEGRRLEQFVPGLAASVAVLAGPRQSILLPAMRQILSDDGYFRYLGGEGPLASELSNRAQQLALRAIAALSPARGYIGVDLVLGDDPSGCQDYVIEINPRCTTSLVGYAALAERALLPLIVAISLGKESPAPNWREARVHFTATSSRLLAPASELGRETS